MSTPLLSAQDSAEIAIIFNPISGPVSRKTRETEIISAAKSFGWEGEIMEVSEEKDAESLAREALARGCRKIIVCGGDGTIRDAIDALANSQAVLGIIPIGTGNQLAHNMNIPISPISRAMEVAIHGRPTSIDLGQVNEHYFALVAGIGWDAAMIRDADRRLKNRLGLFAYLLAAIKNTGHPRAHYQIKIDDNPLLEIKAKSIMVANVGRINGRFNLIPNAQPNDGILNIAAIEVETLTHWLHLCFSVLIGQLPKDTRFTLFEGRKITIRSQSGQQPAEFDGNDLPPTSQLEIKVAPGALRIMLPQN